MTLVDIHSHVQTICLVFMTVHEPSFPVVCLCLNPLENSVQALTAIPMQEMPVWQPHALGTRNRIGNCVCSS